MAMKHGIALALAATAVPGALAAGAGTAAAATTTRADGGHAAAVPLSRKPFPAVLPQTAMSVRGTTLGRYQAVARGEATLRTSRSVCPRHDTGPACHSMQHWNVTVDVR